jgi:hypothetical protein
MCKKERNRVEIVILLAREIIILPNKNKIIKVAIIGYRNETLKPSFNISKEIIVGMTTMQAPRNNVLSKMRISIAFTLKSCFLREKARGR